MKSVPKKTVLEEEENVKLYKNKDIQDNKCESLML